MTHDRLLVWTSVALVLAVVGAICLAHITWHTWRNRP